jgi:CHASE2 domain-containing sensor protein/anti-sigma regulatory factor (Ser/Thr protein kinase)
MGWLTTERRIVSEWLAVALLATVGVALAVSLDLFQRADNLVYDQLIRLKQRPASNAVVIVTIDEESLSRLGGFPWPRSIHARALDRLEAAKPAAVLYDVLFVDPTPDDAELADAVSRTRPVLPLAMEIPGRNGEAVSMVEPVAPLMAAGARVGHANLSPDADGIVRRAYLADGAGGKLWPHVAALAACTANGRACDVTQTSESTGRARAEPFLIPFAGGRHHFQMVPFWALLDGTVPQNYFAGRVVLIGSTAAGLGDAYATPLAERNTLMPGVELNANIVEALMTGRAIAPAGPVTRYALALVPLWLLLAGFLLARPRFNFVLGLALGATTIAASAALFTIGGLWASPIATLAGLIAVYPLWAWRRLEATTSYLREEFERFRRDPDPLLAGARPTGDAVQTDIELLRRAIEHLRSATRQREEALRFLTHDMRSPQASIISTLALSGDAVKPEVAKRIEGHARRTLALADGFVQFARAEEQPIALNEVDLRDIVLDAADELWAQSSARSIRVLTECGQDQCLAMGDRGLLTRAMVNLVGNAIKYSPEGTVVTCTVGPVDGRMLISVEDEGPGLSEEQIEALFQPFRRFGDGGTDGAGLGLAFVRLVATRHGGTVSCESTLGRGSRFELSLPAAA